MREIRLSGSEGGGGNASPYPYSIECLLGGIASFANWCGRAMAGSRCYGGGRSQQHVSWRLSKTRKERFDDKAIDCDRLRSR
jgi:hypothetical protein